MRILRACTGSTAGLILMTFLLLGGCTDQTMSPVEAPSVPDRRLQLAWDGETGVRIKINGLFLADSAKAARLRVEVVADAGRPTFAGNMSNKTVQIGPVPIQADSVDYCPGGQSCEGVHVAFHDQFNSFPTELDANEGVLADGDYKVRLYRDNNILVDSIAIAVNHANHDAGNGTFLDESRDRIITFYLNQNLQRVSPPFDSLAHTRASTHLSASITRPAGADTTINVGQSLSVRGLASYGLNGNGKKYAWDWNATGTNQETFETEFSTSNTASHTYDTPGDYKIRLIVRDGNDNGDVAPRGGHYAVSVTKTVHVVDAAPVASVEVSPSSATIDVTEGVTLDAIMRDGSGNILTGRTVTWTTSNASVVTVPPSGDPIFANAQGGGVATITATSEGISGYATITVNPPVGADSASAAGNTLPASIVNGDMVSVTISMKNDGSTTWTSANFYQLLISQGGEYWMPGQAALTSSVSPGATHTFAFDLGLDAPSHTGNTACFHKMDHAGYFGQENGRFINVTSGGFMSSMAAGGLETASTLEEVADPQSWLIGARSTKPMRFGPGGGQLAGDEAQLLSYRYQHAVPRAIDVVFQIVVDPTQAEILPPQVEADGTGLRWQVATGAPGEYWVRLTGTIPAGTGTIGGFPVRVRPGRTASGILGTVTLHYPAQ